MTVFDEILSPISIAFIVLIVGYYLGRIKLFGVSFDLSGVLIVAVLVGWLLAIIAPKSTVVDMLEYQTYMKYCSDFGTALFVSSIGVSTGSILDFRIKKDIKAMLIGSLMVSSAFITMRIIILLDDKVTSSKLIGSLCGALTTTPGLSAACELENIVLEDVILGYGCTYIFGVLATVLFVQIITRKENIISEDNETLKVYCENKAALGGLIQLGCAVILGRLIGSIEFFNFSLGNSGGMLCSGITIGLIVKKYSNNKILTINELTPFRNIGLVLFFIGNGIPAGMQILSGFDVKMILYGAFMTLVPIGCGTILHKLFFNKGLVATTVAGGMTSTPAIGVLAEKYSNISLSKYMLAYFGALLTIVILIRVSSI